MGDAINEMLRKDEFYKNPKNRIVKFHFYEGKSLISKLIKWRTYSKFSHIAIELNKRVYESWTGNGANGVVISNSPLTYHTKGTKITTIEIEMKNILIWEMFLELQIGKKYDYLGILGFVLDKDLHNSLEWFCSELAETFFIFELPRYKKERLKSPQAIYDMIRIYALLQQKYKELWK
jgi:hypothetical protein